MILCAAVRTFLLRKKSLVGSRPLFWMTAFKKPFPIFESGAPYRGAYILQKKRQERAREKGQNLGLIHNISLHFRYENCFCHCFFHGFSSDSFIPFGGSRN